MIGAAGKGTLKSKSVRNEREKNRFLCGAKSQKIGRRGVAAAKICGGKKEVTNKRVYLQGKKVTDRLCHTLNSTYISAVGKRGYRDRLGGLGEEAEPIKKQDSKKGTGDALGVKN